jgi:serine/threonine protein kinase
MSLTQKLTTFVARCGTPAKFVAKTVIGYAVPGSGPLIELVETLIDCAQKTAKDNLEVDGFASKADLERIETMFDVLLGDMKDVVEKLKPLEAVPEIAKETLRTALATEKHCLAAAMAIRAQGMQLSAVQAELKKLSAGQEELLDLQRRFYGSHLDYIEEQRQHNVAPSQLNERLKKMEEAIFANWHGDHERAETISAQMSQDQPDSAVLAVAEAATQASGHNFVGAARSLTRAARLRPGDAELAEMSRVATKLSRGATPVDPRPDAKKRPKPGETLDGWLLEKLLGFGGWGQVFLARKGDHVRAVKIMHAELSKDAEFVKRFKREMGMLMGLGSHPHLVHIDPEHLFDKADDWNCWYYVMEFVEGITLEEYLRRSGPLTLEQAHVLFDGIADGLKIAHQRGIIHRDIKPANILIRPKSQAAKGRGVLVDFGLAGLVDANTSGAGYTALFAAPEQMREGVSDCRSDVYSLAATVYYSLLYNDPEKRGRYKGKHLPPDVPAEIRALLERCLDNDPGDRPQDAGAFVLEWCKPKEGVPKPPKNLPTVRAAPFSVADISEVDMEELAKLLKKLPSHERNVVRMFYLECCSDEQISEELEIPIDSVRAMLSQAQKKLCGKDERPNDRFEVVQPQPKLTRKVGDTITAALGMKFAWVPPGKSWLGGGGGNPGDTPFTLEQGLWCGIYPVTQAEWQEIMGTNPSHFKDNPRFPVECVSWDDVQEFLEKLNSRGGGYSYRLPCGGEREYICRGGPISQHQSKYHYYFAKSKKDLTPSPTDDLSKKANFGKQRHGPTDVGSYLPNPLGIYDLHGNVYEYTSAGAIGGSWCSPPGDCETSAGADVYEDDAACWDVGFRLLAVPRVSE